MDEPTGTITFLFTDIEGSTRLWEQHPDAMKSSLERHDLLLRDVIERHHGRVFKTIGDAFCTAFSSAPDALAAALAAQKALHSESWPEPIGSIRARMAIHTGTAVERDGDYFGPPLNRVARLLAAGHGGQTLISLATQELVRDQLPSNASLLDLGEHRLKDLFRPERIFQLNTPDLPAEFPPLRTLEDRRTNLPAQPTAFVGRERELAAVLTLIRRPDVRLVTLTGVGGTGKTRLSLQVAADLIDEYEHGVFFVELATVTDPNMVIPKVASTLGVKEVSGQPIEQTLQAELHDKHMLLVLDNLEQVVESAPMIGDLLAGTSTLKIITSSREKLHLRAEHEVTVPPLGLPNIKKKETVAVVSQYEAVALYIQRAKAASDRWEITDDNAPAVAEICVRLDGLPLAIELAAARSKILTPQSILEKLSSRLKALTGGARDLPARQQTIRGMIDWSYDLLDDTEKTLFSRLGVFVGGCTLEAAEAVCREGLSIDVLSGLESLVDKSLIHISEDAAGQTRFLMLETIREYTAEQFNLLADAKSIRDFHTDFFVALSQEAKPNLEGPRQAEYLVKLDVDLDNIRAVFDRSYQTDRLEAALRLGGALERYWLARGLVSEGIERLNPALERSVGLPAALVAQACYAQAGNYCWIIDLDRARTLNNKSLDLFRQLGDQHGTGWAINQVGIIESSTGNITDAKHAFEECAAIARSINDRRLLAPALSNLAGFELMYLTGNLAAGRSSQMEALDLYREVGDPLNTAPVLHSIAWFDYWLHDYESALRYATQALELARSVGWLRGIENLSRSVAHILVCEPDFKGARQLLVDSLQSSLESKNETNVRDTLYVFGFLASHESQLLRAVVLYSLYDTARSLHETNDYFSARLIAEFTSEVDALRAKLPVADFDNAWAEGRALSLDEAVQLALSPY